MKTPSMEKAMNNRQKAAKPEAPKSVMDAIYHRRAVRNYTPRTIARPVIRKLLGAAVHAPTAMHEEPWSFKRFSRALS